MAMVNVNMADGGGKRSSTVKTTTTITKVTPKTPAPATAKTTIASTSGNLKTTTASGGTGGNLKVATSSSTGGKVATTTSTGGKAISTTSSNLKSSAQMSTVSNQGNKSISDSGTGIKTANRVINSTSISSGCSSATSKISSFVTDAGKKVEVSKIDKNGNIISKTAIDKNGNVVYSDSIKSSGCGSYSTTGCGVVKPKSEIKPITTDKKSDKRPPAISGCAAHTTVTTGCSGIKTADIKEKKVKIPLTTSKGKILSDKARSFIKGGAAITAGGALAGPAGVAVATTVVAGKTLVANAPALRENANKAKQIAQDLLSGLKKSQQTLDTLHDKWQGSDANKYIESTRERLKNLEVISQVMELYQKTSEQAAKKVEEAKDFVTNAVDRMNSGGGSASF